MKRLLWAVAAVLFGLAAVPRAEAQSISAELQGTIHDPSGAVVPAADISVRNVATGVTRTTTSNGQGIFDVTDLQPSTYEVTVAAAGFATQRRTGIELTVGAQQVLEFSLNTAGVNSAVEVSAAPPPIELANSALSGVEDSKTTRELPLNGRDWTQLATLQPGVSSVRTQNTLNGSSSNRGSRGFGTQVSINGGRPTQNNYFLDGVSLNDYANATPGSVTGLTLGVDAIEEFSVITSNYNATYGQTSGGVINAMTRAGTNRLHGDVYEFLRNDKLDARNFFDGAQKPPFRRNQFGAAAGGPIRRDRTFVFGNYEGLRQALTATSIATVPSANARAGKLAAGAVTVSPVVTPFLALWPAPNAGLLGNGDTGQYSFTAPSPSTENFGSLRVDHVISDKDSLAGAYSVDDGVTRVPDSLNSTFVNSDLRRNTESLRETHIFSPSLLNVARIGVNRVVSHALVSSPGNNPAATDPTLGVLPGRNAPYLSVPGINTYTGGLNGLATTQFWYTTYQMYDDVALQKQRHSLKAGFNAFFYDSNIQVASVPNGEFDFNSLSDFLTNKPLIFYADLSYGPGQTSGAPTGTGFPKRGFRQKVFAGYLQDDFRVRDNLTLNLGVRYEFANVPGEIHGRISNLRDIYGTNLYPGQPLYVNPTKKNFEPRVGLAWDPFRTGKTSIRAGGGIFDVLPLIYQWGLLDSYSAPFSSLAQISGLPAGSFPSGGYAFLTSGQPAPLRLPSIEYTPHRNYVSQWNASFQRSLPGNMVLLIAYSGTHGVHMPAIANDADLVLPTINALGRLQWPLPIGSGTKFNTSAGGIRQLTWGDSSLYDGLQTRLQKRFSRGFQLVGSFSWQKSIDGHSSTSFPTQYQNSVSTLFLDRHLNRGPSDFNVGRIAILNGLWEVPASKTGPAALKYVTQGWQLGGIFQVNDGLPFTPLINGDSTGQKSGGTYNVPDRVVGGSCDSLTNPGNPNQYINLACYAFPPPGVLGNAGRNSIVGPGLASLDSSVTRNFRLKMMGEGGQLQFRWEMFNLANRANFEPPIPNNKLYNAAGAKIAAAGIITQTATTSRQMQFAMKLIW